MKRGIAAQRIGWISFSRRMERYMERSGAAIKLKRLQINFGWIESGCRNSVSFKNRDF
jgi:hypothetical protein